MAQQLIYTSAARLLDAGRSGFGTVARSKSLSPLLVSTIERVSQFANIRGTDRTRVIFVHRRIVAANNRIQLLSRISDAGADYTGRTNHIAHHLIVTQEEMARLATRGITPADVLMQFTWLTRWDAAPKFFGPDDEVSLERTIQPGGKNSARSHWKNITGNPSHARLLAWDATPRSGVLIIPKGQQPLILIAEALAEFGPLPQSWSRTFTTNLETTDEMADFDWLLCTPDSFSEIEARCGNRARLDLCQPHTLPVPPEPVTKEREIRTPVTADGAVPQQAPETQSPKRQVQIGPRRESPTQVPIPKPQTASPKFLIFSVAAAAMIVFLLGGILLIKRSPKTNPPTDIAAISTDQQDALHKLKTYGIEEKAAEAVVNGAPKGTAIQWAGFITEFIGRIKDPKTVKLEEFNSMQGIPTGNTPSTDGGWLSSLVDAKKQIDSESTDHPDLKAFLVKLDNITKSLKSAAKTGFSLNFSIEDCENFDARLTKIKINKIILVDDFNIKDAIDSGNFTHTTFPYRYEILAEIIRDEFGKPKAEKFKDHLKNTNVSCRKGDVEGFEIALRRRNDAIGINLQDFDTIDQSNFVPDEVKKEIKERIVAASNETAYNNTLPEESSGETNGSKGLDLSEVPEREIIVLSTEELANGVSVKLLTRLFEPHFAALSQNTSKKNKNETIQLDGLKIHIQPEDSNNQKTNLFLLDNKVSFGWSMNNPKLCFKKDSIVYTNPDVSSIRFTLSQNGTEWQSLLLIDQKKFEDSTQETFFTLEKTDPDEVRIIGDFITCISQVKDAQEKLIGDNLKLILRATPSYEIRKTDNSYTIKRKDQEQKQPLIILSKRDKNLIEQSFEKCKSEESNTKKENYNASCIKFFDAIRYAIRGAILAKELQLQDESFINQSEHEEDARNMYQKAGGNSSGFHTWDVELKEIKTKVGDQKLNETLEKLGIKGFSDMPKDSKSYKLNDLNRTMDTLFKNSEAPSERKSLFEELENLNSLQILAPEGRVIFEATRKR